MRKKKRYMLFFRSKMAFRETVYFYLFILPWILGFIIFVAKPLFTAFILSFQDYEIFTPPQWIGLENYKEALSDTVFGKSLFNTFYFACIAVPLQIFLQVILAVLLNEKLPGIGIFRTIVYLPMLMPVTATAVLWTQLLNPEYGWINSALRLFGIEGPNWLGDPRWTKLALVIITTWGVGGGVVILLAGLQQISREMYEAAEIDGASWWQKLRYITIPSLSPFILYRFITGFIAAIQLYVLPMILTGGGPMDSLLMVVHYIFKNAFLYFRMGYASALSWILFSIIFILTIFQLWLSKKWVHYEGEK